MKSIYQRLKDVRPDITDYLIHLTRPNIKDGLITSFDTLKNILKEGLLRAGFGERKGKRTVRGDIPVVCLTEQPLSTLIHCVEIDNERYSGYGIAINRKDIFRMGGNPVWPCRADYIGKDSENIWTGHRFFINSKISDDLQYLYVPLYPLREQPVDWTHEREWRVPIIKENGEGIMAPILSKICNSYYSTNEWHIIVKNDKDVAELIQFIYLLYLNTSNPFIETHNENISYFYAYLLNKSKIISLETVYNNYFSGKNDYGKVETYPYEFNSSLVNINGSIKF